MPHTFNHRLSVGTPPMRLKRPTRPSSGPVSRKRFNWKRKRKELGVKRPGFGMNKAAYVKSLKKALVAGRVPLNEWDLLEMDEKEDLLEDLINSQRSMRTAPGMRKLRRGGSENPAADAVKFFKNSGALSVRLADMPERGTKRTTAKATFSVDRKEEERWREAQREERRQRDERDVSGDRPVKFGGEGVDRWD